MLRIASKNQTRQRVHDRIRKKVMGTPERPRLNVYRSLNHIYVQLIDDLKGVTLAAVAEQAGTYATGLPANIPHVSLPLPFLYESTGVETFFRDNRDPEPRSRRVFSFHRPETLRTGWRSRIRCAPA